MHPPHPRRFYVVLTPEDRARIAGYLQPIGDPKDAKCVGYESESF